MARFIFQLQGVLRQRKYAEDQRQREFAAVQAEMTVLETQLRELDRSVQETTADVRDNRLTGTIDVSFLMAHRRYTLSMHQQALGIAQQMAGVQRRLDAARQALVEAARQRKILEKLRERRQAAWAAEESRKETAILDEVGTRIGYLNGLAAIATARDADELHEAITWGEQEPDAGNVAPATTEEATP